MRFCPLFFVLLFGLTGCYKDFEDLDISTVDPNPVISFGDNTASARGRVLNNLGTPLSGATISNFAVSTQSDENGYYELNDFPIDADGGTNFYITRDGFFPEFRKFYPEDGSHHLVDIVLNAQRYQGIIDAAAGGTFSLESGPSLTINAGSVRNNAGVYTGQVYVTMYYYDPASPASIAQSAANLPARSGNREFELATYGMVRLELAGEDGRQVWIDNNDAAFLDFPVPENLQNTLLDTVMFWQLEEIAWQFQDGLTNRDGSLRARVNYGGLYNCDVPYDRATICGRLVSPEGLPLINQPFTLSLVDGAFMFSFLTDDRGRFCARVARDQLLEILIPDPCNPTETLTRLTLGPYPEGPTEIGDIELDLPLDLKPVAVKKCSDGTVFNDEDGQIWISGYGRGVPLRLNEEGLALLPLPDCDAPVALQIQAVDDDQRQTSELVSLSSNDAAQAGLTVCGDLESDEYFTASIDGGPELTMTRGSYLLRQNAGGQIRHQFWGEHVAGTDTSEFFINLPALEAATYNGNDFLLTGFSYQPGLSYRYTCGSNCPSTTVIISATGPGQSWVEGTFSFAATQSDLTDGSIITNNLPITGTFRLNR